MAASPSVTDELSCSICLDLFDQPVLLPCAHTFCRHCLHEFTARQPSTHTQGLVKTILCPKCRASVKLGPEGVAGLPKNTTLANIILSFEEESQRSLPSLAAATLTPCDVCDTEPPRAGFKSCSDCTLTFCRTCFAALHPIRGAFTHHVITSPAPFRSGDQSDGGEMAPRASRTEKRGGGGRGGGGGGANLALHRVRSLSPLPKETEHMEKIRVTIRRKRKHLKETLKEAQDLLKTTEDETEDQMKQIKTLSCRLHEGVAEREGGMLASCTRRRHEAVTCCYSLVSDTQAKLLELDLLDEKFGMILVKGPIMDTTHELACLEERLAALSSTSDAGRLDDVPRPRQLCGLHVATVLRDLDFKQDKEVAAPVITDVMSRPVAKGPAVVDVKWAGSEPGSCYRLTAFRKTQKGRTERVIVDDVTGGSQLMLLPGIDAQYRLVVTALGRPGDATLAAAAAAAAEEGASSEEKLFRTLPYVNCISLRFDPAFCHKAIAVSSSREETMHRKCKLANLAETHAPATFRRLDELEGARGDNPFPNLPHMYWECLIHFHVISRLDDSKLVCDVGVCKTGMEDACGLVCDNPKAYCCYLVKRDRFITLEFWDGPNQEILARTINVADLDRDNEKTLRLGFYLDVSKKVFAVINPAASSVLAQFNVKFTSLVWLAGLYCPDQVYATIKNVTATNVPTVVGKLIAKTNSAAAAAAAAAARQ